MNVIDEIKREATTARWVGLGLIVVGILALLAPLAAGQSVVLLLGVLLFIGGAGQLLLTFRARSLGSGVLIFLLGALSSIGGIYMIAQPTVALAILTLFLAVYFIASGVVEIVASFGARPASGWGWFLFGGIVSVLLGLMIWSGFPLSGIWAVGILLGIRLVLAGIELVAIAGATRQFITGATQ